MPIVISRKSGQIISRPDYSPEQIERAGEVIVRAWAQSNKDYLRGLGKEMQNRDQSDTYAPGNPETKKATMPASIAANPQ